MLKREVGKERKRRIILAATIEGKPLTEAAAAAGCGTRHAQRLNAEPATQLLITDLMRPHDERLRMLIPKCIRAIERSLVAQKTTRSDHTVQLLGVRRAKDFLLMAQGPLPPQQPKPVQEREPGVMTWEEFEITWRKGRQNAV